MIDKVSGTSKEGTTEQFAKQNYVKPQTVLRQHSLYGAYQGISPIRKLPNGRIIWPLMDETTGGGNE
jgi:hypothetical protein